MQQYLDLVNTILTRGEERPDRTGTGTKSIFGHELRFNLAVYPLLTTKKLSTKAIIYELLWFLKGGTNISYLNEHGVHIWDEWADEVGDLGPVYGKQWRSWEGADGRTYDQIRWVINEIKTNPFSRRLVVSSWNVADLDDMRLLPCHVLFQFYVSKRYRMLSCNMYQRSADVFLGLPFNIASYALLTQMVAHLTGYEPGVLTISLGDAHLYLNHLDQAQEQLRRNPRPLPEMRIRRKVEDIDDFAYEDFELLNYKPHPHLKAQISV